MVSGSNTKPAPLWRTQWHWAFAFLSYLAITIAVTWPLTAQFADFIPGPHASDTREFVWSQWWWWHALSNGLDPAHLTSIQYPGGMEFPLIYLMSQSFILGLPITALTGPTIALNLLFLASFPTTAIATYALCLELGADRRGAFLGGLIWAFFPNRMGHALAGHMFFLLTFSLPWMALAWLRLLKEPNWRHILGAGLVTALACTLHPLNVAYFVAPVLVALTVARLLGVFPDSDSRRWGWVGGAALALALAGAALLPLAWPTLAAQGQLNYLSQSGATNYSIDPTTLLSPAPDSPLPLSDSWREAIRRGTGSPFENIGTLGWLPLLLAGVGLWRWRRGGMLWGVLAIVGIALALGPVLKVGGTPLMIDVEPNDPTRIVLPYAWLVDLPLFGWSRTPSRFLVLTALGLSVLAAQGASSILRSRAKAHWAGTGAIVLTCGIVLAEYTVVWPFQTEPVQTLPILSKLQGPILPIPWGGNEGNLVTLYWQTQHEQPQIGGRMYRDLPGYRAIYDGLRNLLLEPIVDPDIVPSADDAERRAALAASGARSVLWDAELAGSADRRDLLEQRLGPPSADDGRLAIFPVPGEPIPEGEVIWGLSTGWQPVENWGGAPWRWIEDRASLVLASARSQRGRLTFTAQPGTQPRWVTVRVAGQTLVRFGIADWASYDTPEFELPAGLTQVDLIVEGPLDHTTSDPRCWVQSPVFGPWPGPLACNPNDDAPRQFTVGFSDFGFAAAGAATNTTEWRADDELIVSEPAVPTEAKPGERLWIPITLEATRDIGRDLTVFIHVLAADGSLVAQADAQPVRSALPTRIWRAGDVVSYRAPLDLPSDLPAGTVTLRLGLYPTGEPQRLQLSGVGVENDTILLGSLGITP